MYQHILIPSDGSELAGKGAEAGIALAKALQAKVTFLTVTEPWQDVMPGDPSALALSCELRDEYRQRSDASAGDILDALVAKAEAAGVPAERIHVRDMMPSDGILETAGNCGADLVVMASHGRRGLGQLLLGSQTNAVVTKGRLPVLVMR